MFLYAFDLLELNGKDLRREPLEHRKRELTRLLRNNKAGLQLNEHIAEPGDIVFRHACARIRRHRVEASRLPLRSGRSRDWLKSKNLNAPAVKREAEEDWGKENWR